MSAVATETATCCHELREGKLLLSDTRGQGARKSVYEKINFLRPATRSQLGRHGKLHSALYCKSALRSCVESSKG